MWAAGRGAAGMAIVVGAMFCMADGLRKGRELHRNFASCGKKGVEGASAHGNETSIAIINGLPADECEWRWMIGLTTKVGGMPFCGGMLISPKWVLTAAHCVNVSKTNPNFFAVAGDYKPKETSGKEQVRRAIKVYESPSFNPLFKRFDISLVELESPMELNGCVGTVCLPEPDADVQPETKCWITGWGLKGGWLGDGTASDTLLEAPVTTISNDDCLNKKGYKWWDIHYNNVCAQGKTEDGKITDSCAGDSGGPLVCEAGGTWTLYGITSWGNGCAEEKHPGIYCRVHGALEWIESTMSGSSEV